MFPGVPEPVTLIVVVRVLAVPFRQTVCVAVGLTAALAAHLVAKASFRERIVKIKNNPTAQIFLSTASLLKVYGQK